MRAIFLAALVAGCTAAPARANTRYVFGGSGRNGEYDCSGYVNSVLRERAPRTYADVARLRHRPRTREYVESILGGGDGWRRVERVSDLRPGDILAWTHPGTQKDPASTGHIMIVAAPPRRDPRWPDAWQVRVDDSARSGHSDDTRAEGASGIGEGTLLLETDGEGVPLRFAWSLRGKWQQPDAVAMGRPAVNAR